MESSPALLPSPLELVDAVRNCLFFFMHHRCHMQGGKPDQKPDISASLCPTVLNQQMMIMELFIITLVNRFLYRRPYDPLPPEPDNNDENSKINFDADIAEEDVWREEEEKEPAMLFYAL